MEEENKTPVESVDLATKKEEQNGNEEQTATQAPSQEKSFTKRERLLHAQEKIERQLAELEAEEDDNRPITVGDLKKMKRDEVKQTALQLAESIEDADERVEVIRLLEDRIQPSNNPEEDLKLARTTVNALKNERVLEELSRKGTPNSHASIPGAPGKNTPAFTPTPQEAELMRAFGLTQEDVIRAREREAQK